MGLLLIRPTDQELSGLISASALGFLSSGQLIQGLYTLSVSVFQCVFSMFSPFSLEEG